MRNRFSSFARPFWALIAALCAVSLPAVPIAAQEVVQALPNPAAAQLSEAMRRLAVNAESLPALIDAGRASLELDDVDAAEGFFARASDIDASDNRVLSGLAIVALRHGDPVVALNLFERAAAEGAPPDAHAADHGLAFDLIGDNARAQQLYGLALSRGESAETVRRLALSYAIAGDKAASEATLLPLLQRSDLAAYRTRAFALAILGQQDEAISIAETLLPTQLARRIAPYLRYMPRLTRAQQAAAANLGTFPAAGQIGRDDPRMAQASAAPAPAPRRSTPDQRLVPQGEPLARASRPTGTLTDPVAADLPDVAQPEQASIDDVFADFSLAEESATSALSAGAVDITRIEPPREERAPPPNPSRHWVQVATGQDVAAFRFDWRRLVRNASGLLDGRDAYRARWNSTNRLLTGPFDSASAAQDFVTALAREGVSAFRFTSAAGEEVLPVE